MMMTPDDHIAGLDLTTLQVERMTAAAFDELLRRVNAGEDPQPVLREIEAAWSGEYRAMLAARLSERMAMSIGAVEVKEWPVGEVTLSARLREHARDVSALTRRIVAQHAAGWHDARSLAMDLYEGYRFRPGEPLAVSSRKSIPKYLRAALGDDAALADLFRHKYTGQTLRALLDDPMTGQPLAQQYARIKASQIKTPALKAAYAQAIEAIEQGKGAERLKKLLKTAYYEKNRYFANRIAQTELHRVYTDRQAADLMSQDRIEYVQIRLSGTHPVTDICDYHAKVDHYGLGPGVYPKSLAPKAPFHPWCRCLISPRVDIPPGLKYREREGAGRAWLREQGPDGARVLGSRDKLAAVLQGADVNSLVNAVVPGAYRVRRLGEVDF